MKTLFLVRHAEAVPPQGISDPDRRLTAAGGRQAAHAAEILRSRKLSCERIVASPALRTWETACVLAAAWQYPTAQIVSAPTLYLGAAGDYAAVIRKTPPRYHSLALIGHNPVVGRLASQLSQYLIARFPPMAMAVFTLDTPSWEDYEMAPARLLFTDMPA